MEEARAELLAAAAELTRATEALGEKFAKTEAFTTETRAIAVTADRTAHKQQRITVVVVGVMAVLAAVVVGLIVALVRVDNADSRSIRNQEYAEASCTSTNATRIEAKSLWDGKDGILQLIAPPGKKQTPEMKKFIADLRAKVNAVYVLRDCTKVADGKVK